MNSVTQPSHQQTSADTSSQLADIHDRVMEAYYGKLGEQFMRETQERIHWICAHVAGNSVLDVGCSQGIVPLLLAREGCKVIGVDTSPQAIEEATQYLRAEPEHVQRNVTYVNADFLALDVEDIDVETIVISEVLEHLVRPELFVAKASSLLKKGGRLIVTVPFGVNDFIDHKHTFYLQEPYRLLARHLEVTEVKMLGKWLGLVAIKKEERPMDAQRDLPAEQIFALERAFEHVERSLRQELGGALKRLDETNKKYRSSTEQVATLKQNLTAESAKSVALSDELVGLKAKLDESNRKYRAATEQADSLKTKSEALNEAKSKAEQECDALHEQLAGEINVRRELEAKCQAQVQERDALLEQLDQEIASREATETLLDENSQQWEEIRQRLENELGAAKGWLESANQKYRIATGEQIPHFKSNLETLMGKTREQQKKIEELSASLKDANSKRQAAEQRLIKTRASLTYQLGYQLKAGATSVGGFVRLPKALLGLCKKAYRQGKKRRQKLSSVSVSIKQSSSPAIAKPFSPAVTPLAEVSNAGEIRQGLLRTADVPASQLKVACIMDEFTYGSYRYECNLMQLSPDNWRVELQDFQPELLFIESAWRGKENLWGSKVGHNSQELQGILAWCRNKKVPTVFWNKEDPVHFETFLTTAKQFDFVFTTDIDCIHRYKAALGHDRVYLLPFACQPAVHNPIELYQRKDAFCFAGAYYVRYPERTRDLDNFVAKLPEFRPLEIFDRNYGKNDPNYQFPEKYQSYIVGTLPFDQIDKAYKGYRYSINLNSIKQSQSMFARRVYELLGSNTVTVSNFSRGVRLLFGDLVVTTDDGEEMVRRLGELAQDEETSGKLRLAALRKVMQEHTYGQRLNYVLAKVAGQPVQDSLPQVVVVGHAANERQAEKLLTCMLRQQYTKARMYLVTDSAEAIRRKVDDPRIAMLTPEQLGGLSLGELTNGAQWVAGMSAEDYYGPNYLLDIALATCYSQAQVIGKADHYACDKGSICLVEESGVYRQARELAARRAAIKADLVSALPALDWAKNLEGKLFRYEQMLAIDPYNYCHQGAEVAASEAAEQVDDLALNVGLSINDLQSRAEGIKPAVQSADQGRVLNFQELAKIFGPIRSKHVQFELSEAAWHISSNLADGKHEYLYAGTDLKLEELGVCDKLKLFLDAGPGLSLQLVLLFLDAQKQRISHVIYHANRNQTAEIPPETAFVRLGWRVYSGGSTDVKGLVLEHRDLQPSEMLERAEHLLVTNHYPSYEDLYRNGFVHSRVTAYRERGVLVDVFRLRKSEAVSYHEFQDVDVVTGSQEILDKMLQGGHYKSVLVHFLDPDMWEVLQKHVSRLKVIVWVHGAEVQPWWRREYNYSSEDQLQVAKLESEKRMAFWRGLLQPMPENLKLVFVSRYFAEEVMEDIGFRIPENQYEIIHNPINTELFSYQEKPAEQRKKILSIRPYASAKYANDLSVKAIELLAKKPWFKELEIRMIGDGVLFDETLEPLRKYPNVRIERGFLKQNEIAALHKEYGIFLCPTRMDAQGVSRDEAMSSGLVPVTNGITAIPEFVDESCGVLAAGDNFQEMAEGIARLVESPELFKHMSSAAAARVRGQTAEPQIVGREIELF
ncbi:glycosyltransferase family protein [Pseudomonas oryzae]|uniref:Spore maturation protein CgeB n=1 Tax=Pseudomonas oryzae TaxID=1392877 RepID=A0A1H1VUR3_9PSED|nr:glycosyltransferase [Pseudomonas oryzae]SDS87966.1 Spore maturation protein CgeB [Pseudomonas oryzae]